MLISVNLPEEVTLEEVDQFHRSVKKYKRSMVDDAKDGNTGDMSDEVVGMDMAVDIMS